MQLHLPASYGAQAPGIVRRTVACDEDMALVVTELVSNGLRHAGGDVLVVIVESSATRRVEVWDTSSEPPRMQVGSLDAESGRGLLLVDTLAATWGWSVSHGTPPWAKVVYAEMAAPQAATTLAAGLR